MVVRKLDIESWVRRPHFENFRKYSDPFFNITAEVEITNLLKFVREKNVSFFIASYFFLLKIANEIPEFRYRLRGDDVVVHDVIHGSCTVLNSDETFSFCFFDFVDDFKEFERRCLVVLERNKKEKMLEPRFDRDDVIHSSIIPWVRFSSFDHAKRSEIGDSCPKVVLGKYEELSGRIMMPISVSAHHALMDGIHASRFFLKYEEIVSRSAEI